MSTISVADILKENEQLSKELDFLKERNKDLRQKTWYSVYEENLKLNEEIKNLKECNQRHFDLRLKYYIETKYLNEENKRLKDAIASVQEFTKQFT
jgi:hypothetical protein